MNAPMTPQEAYRTAYRFIRSYARVLPYADAHDVIYYLLIACITDQRMINAIRHAHESYEHLLSKDLYEIPFTEWFEDTLWTMDFEVAENLRTKIRQHRFSYFDIWKI